MFGQTCEFNTHVSHGNNKRCDCGERSNPAYRTWWQRRKDKRDRRMIAIRRWWRESLFAPLVPALLIISLWSAAALWSR